MDYNNAQTFEEKINVKNNVDEQIKTLRWTVSLIQLKLGLEEDASPEIKSADLTPIPDKRARLVSDPLIKAALFHLSAIDPEMASMKLVAAARGLKMESVEHIMGNSVTFKDDQSYLKNISLLPKGVYNINFSNWVFEHKGHAITYVKEEDGSGYLLDPNGAQLKCEKAPHPDDAEHLLHRILSFYIEATDHPAPLRGEGDRHHQIYIYKYEPIVTEHSLDKIV